MSVHRPPDDVSSTQPRVNLYLVNPSDCRPSMDRYGRTLERALRYLDPPVDVHTVTPPPWPQRDDSPFGRLAENVGKYRVRYADYPRRVSSESALVHHVVDHSYAHLVQALGARRTVVTCHDLMPLRMADGRIPGARISRIALLAFRYAVRHLPRAAGVVCVSQATVDDVRRYLDCEPARLHVVHSGVADHFRAPPSDEVAQLRERLELPSIPLLLHVGGADAYKNIEGALDVVHTLRQVHGIDCGFVKAGERLTTEQWRLARSLGLEPRIVETGYVPEPDLPALYACCQILLAPSHWEGFGWPALEAMACGTPAVTSDCPAFRETAGPAALQAPAIDTQGLAAAAARLLRDDGARRAAQARGLVLVQRFRWDRTARDLAEIYATVAATA
ncbi:MAG: glycosyltransferase family 1 protein [Chloroflexi bacterium]|nr:glycosyltransferase family 1 protein [Chloroflexota bacterium]